MLYYTHGNKNKQDRCCPRGVEMKGCEVEAIESDGFSRTCGSDRNQGVAGPRATWYCKDCVNKLINNWMIMLDTPEFDDDDAGMVRDEMKDYLATQILNKESQDGQM